MSLSLPAPVAAYLAAEKAKDADGIASCFAADGRVRDESRDHRGRDAIRAWKREVDEKYRYVLEPLGASQDGQTLKLRARVAGEFPGSPAELDFTFTLANGGIASLEIG
jgi:hypothetical protein